MNQKIITATIPILVLLLGLGVGQAKAWDDGGGGGCCFGGGGFHHCGYHWGYFHHWGFNGCGYGCGDNDYIQGPDDNGGPSTSSNQGTSVNVINSPGATVNTYQSASSIIQPIVRGLCAITQVDCNQGQVGYQGGP